MTIYIRNKEPALPVESEDIWPLLLSPIVILILSLLLERSFTAEMDDYDELFEVFIIFLSKCCLLINQGCLMFLALMLQFYFSTWNIYNYHHRYTLSAARACFLDSDLGSLSPGKLADFVVLSIYSWDDFVAEGSASIDATYVGGVQAYPWNPIILERIMCSTENRNAKRENSLKVCWTMCIMYIMRDEEDYSKIF